MHCFLPFYEQFVTTHNVNDITFSYDPKGILK